jgi:hypothetical protein
MTVEFGFTEELVNTQYAPLAALFVRYQQEQTLQPLENVQILGKVRDFSSLDKLTQLFVSILAGCDTLSEVNPRLGSEMALAEVWGWTHFAEQSNLSRLLDQLTLKQLDNLRAATTQIWRNHSQTMKHDWRGYLWLDYDLSGLPCGVQAEASQKGYFSDKTNVSGRQLARVSVVKYRETIWSDVFPGNYHTVHCLQPAVQAAGNALELALSQRDRVVWRLDGGSGSEQKMRWLVGQGYQLLAKGMNHNRTMTLARQVQRWDTYGEAWVAEVPAPQDYARPVRVFVKRRWKDGEFQYCYYVTTLSLPSKGNFLAFYDARGGAEVEQFRNDKSGLSLATRRKHAYLGQIGYILLTDLAHNLLADFYHRALAESRFKDYGLKRIVRDLLATPGRLIFDEQNHLQRIELLSQKQYAEELLICLERYCSGSRL